MINNCYRFIFNPASCEYWLSHYYWNKATNETYSHITRHYKANEKIQRYFAEHGEMYYSDVFKCVLIDIDKSIIK